MFALLSHKLLSRNMDNVKHFVLVHGACHGAWCWYKLVALLRHAGHHVTALDLGGSGIHSDQIHEVTSIWDYVQPLMEFLGSIPEDEKVILVGHSYGGLPISLAMEMFPQKISVAAFVTAYLPHYTFPPGVLIQEVCNFCIYVYILIHLLHFCFKNADRYIWCRFDNHLVLSLN